MVMADKSAIGDDSTFKLVYALTNIGLLARMNGIQKKKMKKFFEAHPEYCQAQKGQADVRGIVMFGYELKEKDWPKTVGEDMQLRNKTTDEFFEEIKLQRIMLGDGQFQSILGLME